MTDSKFKALVHYICEQCVEAPVKLGMRRLNAILWNSDLAAYTMLGEALTEQIYVRRQFGPASAHTETALLALQNEGKVLVRRNTHPGHPRFLILSLQSPAHSFGHDQINLVDRVIDWIIHDHVASAVRVFAENNTWKKAEIGQEVPHCMIYSTKRAEIREAIIPPEPRPSKSENVLSLVVE